MSDVIPLKPRVIFLLNSLAGGGAERVMMTLLRHSEDRRSEYDIHLVLLDDEAHEAYSPPEWATVHRLRTQGSLPKGLSAFVKLAHQLKPKFVLSFLTRANVINAVSSRMLKHRAVISERANTSGHFKGLSGAVSKTLVRTIYPLADQIICVSGGIAEDLRDNFAIAPSKLVSIPNPINREHIVTLAVEAPPMPLTKPYFLAMGRFVESKNFSLLIEALSRSAASADLVILGKGPLEARLKEEAERAGLGDRVHFPGFSANPFPYIRNALAFVLPSNGEGFPNALAEAMTLGIPVISTNCRSGPSEILNEQASVKIDCLLEARYGLLVPVNDADAMAAALDMYSSSEARLSWAKKALAGAARYDMQTTINRYWDVLTARKQEQKDTAFAA
jgi:glycosyltransferase involved in cell wall biosynthesis